VSCACRNIYRDDRRCALCQIADLKAQLETVREQTRREVMDEFGILYGEDAKRLIAALEDTSPPSQALVALLKGE